MSRSDSHPISFLAYKLVVSHSMVQYQCICLYTMTLTLHVALQGVQRSLATKEVVLPAWVRLHL